MTLPESPRRVDLTPAYTPDECRRIVDGDGPANMADGLEDFTRGYAECALWAGLDYSRDEDGNPPNLDANYGMCDIDAEACAAIVKDCGEFIEANRARLETAMEAAGINWSRLGFCFYLSRNGHGSGYFDEVASSHPAAADFDLLQEAARKCGEFDLIGNGDSVSLM